MYKTDDSDNKNSRKTNTRRYKGAKGRRPDRKRARQEGAQARQKAYDILTVAEKMARLPVDGAVKQRAKLSEK